MSTRTILLKLLKILLSLNSIFNNQIVLLLEAGAQENLLMDIPLLVNFLQLNSDVNWAYKVQSSNSSCLAMKNNRFQINR